MYSAKDELPYPVERPAARNSDSKVSTAALADGREVVGDTDGRDGEGDAAAGLLVRGSAAAHHLNRTRLLEWQGRSRWLVNASTCPPNLWPQA